MLKQSPTTEGDKEHAEYFSIFISEFRYCNPAFKVDNISFNLHICKTQIDVQSNRRPILKYMAIFHFLKSTSIDVTDLYFKWRHTR